MKAHVVHRVVEAQEVSTKHGPRYVAELEIIGQQKRVFWMSIKQGEHLVDCACRLELSHSTKRSELHVVIDDSDDKERFVWCGLHTPSRSDLPFLERRFGVTCESPYIGRMDASQREAHPQLLDD